MLRTRVFDLAAAAGFATDEALARAIGVSPATVSRIKAGQRPVSNAFITGALRAFPAQSFEDLFYLTPDREPAVA